MTLKTHNIVDDLHVSRKQMFQKRDRPFFESFLHMQEVHQSHGRTIANVDIQAKPYDWCRRMCW